MKKKTRPVSGATAAPAPGDLPDMAVTRRGRRTLVSTGSPWEPKVGYSRAVRAGHQVAVTGTVGILRDGTFPPTAAAQARRALQIIEGALRCVGATLEDVVRTRMFVTDISQWRDIGGVHAEFFGDIRPATTMVQVAKLIDDAAFVEIEADAVVEARGKIGTRSRRR